MSDTVKNQTGEVSEITIFDILGGAVKERANYELTKAIQNCRDINTEFKKARKLTLEFTFTPSEARDSVHIDFAVKPKLIPIKSLDGTLLLGGTMEEPVVMEYTPQIPGQRNFGGSEQDEPKVIKLADVKRA